MRIADTSDLWWKTAVVYCLDVERYLDANGDGIGDLEGLARRIDYLADLGVTCVWLMPFYPSPGRDDGYDITDFYGVDPRLGSLGDLVEVVRTCRDRGIRVIVDLVVNHTSDRHPWFVSARRSRTSRFRDYYVWRDRPPRGKQELVFPGEETSTWELDERTGQYFLHSFYRHQPDLNVANPAVRDEITKVIGFWLQTGVSGFRIDAVPFLIEGTAGAEAGDPHDYLRHIREFAQRRSSEVLLLGEVNLSHREQLAYFGDEGDELTMQFDFPSNQYLYLSLVRGDPRPLVRSLKRRPELVTPAQWANFVRNHDELTLDKLTERQREEVFEALAPDPSQRIYGRGITRRLPSMLGGDPRRIRMVYSLLLSLPGTPVLFYGEEIGMAENPEIEGRKAVRTPMQWAPERNGGFSTASPGRLTSRPPAGPYGPEHVNVVRQRDEDGSLLRHIRLLISRRRASPELGWGRFEAIEHPSPGVMVHSVRNEVGRFVAVHNLRSEPATVEFSLSEPDDVILTDLLGEERRTVVAPGELRIPLDGYGFRWFRVGRPGDGRLI